MRHLLFICLLLFCVACEENESVDPTIARSYYDRGEYIWLLG